MTEIEALDELGRMVAWEEVPALTAAELTELLDYGRRVDEYDATEAWDLNAAAAEGWRRKAGKVAGRFDFGTADQNFNRKQVFDMCQAMSETYRKKVIGSVTQSRTGLLSSEFVVGN
jgi:hypothetical protein